MTMSYITPTSSRNFFSFSKAGETSDVMMSMALVFTFSLHKDKKVKLILTHSIWFHFVY